MQAWPSGKAWRWHSFQLGLEAHQSPRVFCNADSLQHFTILPLLPVTTNFITTSITTFIIAYLTDITPYYFSSPLCYYYLLLQLILLLITQLARTESAQQAESGEA